LTQFTITTNDRAVLDALQQAANQITDLTPVMESIGEHFLLRTRERFDTETAPGGNRWAALAQATVKAKERRALVGSPDVKSATRERRGRGRSRVRSNARPSDILKDTFLLRDTVTYQASAVSVAVGTPQRYGLHHQYGTKKMPARPFLGVDEQDRQEIIAIVGDYLLG
jgi:phage gpG-like protein